MNESLALSKAPVQLEKGDVIFVDLGRPDRPITKVVRNDEVVWQKGLDGTKLGRIV